MLALLKPYRRRQVSAAERERLTAIGSAALGRHRAAGNCENADTAPGIVAAARRRGIGHGSMIARVFPTGRQKTAVLNVRLAGADIQLECQGCELRLTQPQEATIADACPRCGRSWRR